MSDRRPSTYDIARLAGVSRSTVSFVLNDRQDIWISEETRARVLDVAKKLNYRPNRLAKALITGTSRLVGLWMWSVSTPFNVSIIDHTLDLMHADGYQAIFFEMQGLESGNELPDPGQWPLDGIIAEGDPAFLETFIAQHRTVAPIVTLGVRTSPLTDQVIFDISTGVRESMSHLANSGRKRIAHLLPESIGLESNEARRSTYEACMREMGGTPEYIECDFSARSREMAMSAIADHIKQHGCPEAIFCHNDEMAVAANRILRQLGICVPADVHLIGCDGWIETEYQEPQLSTIGIPLEEGCREAWAFLRNRIADPDLPRQSIILPTHLIHRASSS